MVVTMGHTHAVATTYLLYANGTIWMYLTVTDMVNKPIGRTINKQATINI